jgi:uncharacterized protein YjdB
LFIEFPKSAKFLTHINKRVQRPARKRLGEDLFVVCGPFAEPRKHRLSSVQALSCLITYRSGLLGALDPLTIMKRYTVLLLAISLFMSCKKDNSNTQTPIVNEPAEVKLQSLTLDNNAITLKVSETKQLTFTALPSNASNKVITYTSSDETIATVSYVGLVKAVKSGTATISATNAKTGLVAQCKVTVPPILVSSITIGIETITGSTLGYTKQLTATVLPANAANTKITWYSSDPSKVSVSSDGMIIVLGYGVAIITAKSTDGSNVTSSSCTVTVTK